jgi:F0F1-type ATP synthase assembly protein I
MNEDLSFALTVGTTIALALIGGVLFGLWLNNKFNMAPWGILIGMLAGMILATTVLIIRTRGIIK